MTLIIAQAAREDDPSAALTRQGLLRRISTHSAAALKIALLLVLSNGASAAQWGCYGTKPGHPTPEERAAFIREASELAVKAEKAHGVPASVLAAMAIAESGYGWTRVAMHANNVFAWRFVPSAASEGRRAYISPCEKRRGIKHRYVAFKSRADAFDFVAAKLATLEAYRDYTAAYKAARARGEAHEPSVKAWLSGIASNYSQSPAEFTRKIVRIMNNPFEPADVISPELNLHRLSGDPGVSR